MGVQFSKMNRSVQIVVTVMVLTCSTISAQSTHFLPPAPLRFDPTRPLKTTENAILTTNNEYINKVFAGAWFRSNFEDLLSYRGANKLEWYEVLEVADCSPVPATVNAGRPPRDICLDAGAEERRCICVNTGRDSSSTGYERICGTCRNPCLFKFTPDKVPKYVQKLAVIDDKDYDYNDNRNLKKSNNNEYEGDYDGDYYYDDK